MTAILGINALHADSAACLATDRLLPEKVFATLSSRARTHAGCHGNTSLWPEQAGASLFQPLQGGALHFTLENAVQIHGS